MSLDFRYLTIKFMNRLGNLVGGCASSEQMNSATLGYGGTFVFTLTGTKTMKVMYYQRSGANINCIGSDFSTANSVINIFHESDGKVFILESNPSSMAVVSF